MKVLARSGDESYCKDLKLYCNGEGTEYELQVVLILCLVGWRSLSYQKYVHHAVSP